MKNNFITKIIGASLAIAMMIGVGAGLNAFKEAKRVDADSTTLSISTYASANNWANGTAYNANYGGFDFKYGGGGNNGKYYTSDHSWRFYNGGSMTIEADSSHGSYTITSVSSNPTASFSVSNGKASASFSATIKFTSITVNYTEGSSGATALANPNPQYNDSNKTVSWTTDVHASKYQVKVDTGEYEDINTETYDASSLAVGVQHTVYIKAVGDETNYSSTEGSVKFTPTAPFVAKVYAQCTSVSDLEVGASYLITSGTSGTVKTMSKTANSNNRPAIDITVTNSKITSTSDVLTLTLGGTSDAWTLQTENYSGTNGYLASATSGGSGNHCRVISDETTGTISFDSGKAVINLEPHSTRSLLRYNPNNGNPIFACYASGQNDIYLWKEYKVLDSLSVTGELTKTSYYESETFDPTGLTISAVYTDSSSRTLPANAVEWPALVAGMTHINGSYTENNITKQTSDIAITVAADTLSTVSLSGSMVTTYFTNDNWNKGSLVVTANYASNKHFDVTDSATITYYSDSAMNNEVNTPADLGVGENQTVYVKATYNAISNTEGYPQIVNISVEHGSELSDPLTVAEAVAKASSLEHNTETAKQYYIQGTVSEIFSNELNSANNHASFWLQNGSTSQGFQVYQIKPVAECTNYNDFKVGSEVLIRGTIKNYNSISEIGNTKSLISITYSAPALTGISLNKDELYLKKGTFETLTVVPEPLGAEIDSVSWVSSDENVATVDQNGKVTGVDAGLAEITATSGGFSASCIVEVMLSSKLSFTTDTSISSEADYVSWKVGGTAQIDLYKSGSSTAANNYVGKDNHTRIYAKQMLVITDLSDSKIEKIEFTTVSGYTNGLKNSTCTNGTIEVSASDTKVVVVTPTNKANPVSINIDAAARITSAEVFYSQSATEKIEKDSLTQTQLSYRYSKENTNYSYSDISMRFGGSISKDLWNRLNDEETIVGVGVMITAYEEQLRTPYLVKEHAGEAVSSTGEFNIKTQLVDYYVALSSFNPAEQDDNYYWNLRYEIDSVNDILDSYTAAAYIKLSSGKLVFLKQVKYSVWSLAKDYLDNRNCDEETAGGSLYNLVNGMGME